MARIETVVCDGCGATIPRAQVHVQIKQIDWLDISRGAAYGPVTSYDENLANQEIRKLFKEPKDFCDLLCVSRWIERFGPSLIS